MQLNVALQTEIVRFTVLGIQKAIRDVEESMLEQERLSTGGTSFFVSTRAPVLVHAHVVWFVFLLSNWQR